MPPKVSVIILNWNQPKLTVDCVKSVLKQEYKDFEILLVDNASNDNSVEIFRKEFGCNELVRVFENPENQGYAGGNNEGVKHSKGDYIAILNNDTIVPENWLWELINGVERDETIGAVSSIEIRNNQKERNWRESPLTYSLVGYPVGFSYKRSMENSSLLPIFGIVGCSFIYKKRIVGLPFDPEYFIYNEETYLAWLLSLKGYQNKIAVNSKVHHFHSVSRKSSRKVDKYFIFLGERNRLLNLLLFYEPRNLLKISPLILTSIFLANLIEPKKIPYRIKSYFWLLSHPKTIMQKRKVIQKQRKLSDKEIISKMSYKFYEDNRIENIFLKSALKTINHLSYVYCRLLRINTLDISD